MNPLFIGLGYRKQVGKDVFAAYLKESLCHLKIPTCTYALADPLKALVHSVYGVPYEHLNGSAKQKELPSVVDDLTVRQLLQRFGCEMRESHPGIWAGALRNRDWGMARVVIVTDVRFPDEVEMVRELGGVTVRIDRPGSPEDSHKSEHLLSDRSYWDLKVQNGDDLIHLSRKADDLASNIRRAFPYLA